MTREQVEELLRSQPDPLERDYRSRPLPLTIEAARRVAPAPRLPYMQMAAAGVAGALVALALIAAGSAARLFESRPSIGDPPTQGSEAVRPCRSEDFDLRTQAWPDAPMAGGVLVIFEARQAAECVIDRGVYASVDQADGDGGVAAALVMQRNAVQVEPGMAFELGVYWSTYCGTAGGTVAAPEHPARPLTLSVGLAVDGGEDDGVPISVPGTLIPVETSSEIAPEPCVEEYPGSPFWLGFGEFAPYSTSASATERPSDDAEALRDAAEAARDALEALRHAAEAAQEAAELFEQTDTCATVLADHDTVITFPDQWSTNREAPDGGVPCLWFGPSPLEVVAGAQGPPAGAAITMGAVGGPPGEPSSSADVMPEDVTVAGRPALRVEERGTGDDGAQVRRLTYWVSLGVDAAVGPTLVATTSSADAGSYELNAAVLDEMMRRLEIRDVRH